MIGSRGNGEEASDVSQADRSVEQVGRLTGHLGKKIKNPLNKHLLNIYYVLCSI